MIDTHCHLTDERLSGQLAGVLARFAAAGVTDVVTIGTTPEDAEEARQIAAKHPTVRYAAGIHPNNTGPYQVHEVQLLRQFAADARCVALGEMGLDYHYDDVPKDHQKAMFRAQLHLATELKMPVIVHCREAAADTLEVFSEFPEVRAVFHCFTGTLEEGRAILAAGFYLGFTGPITFKKNDGLREIVAACPLERLLVETDAPYLTPEPHRSIKTNEPMYVRQVLETVARIHGVSVTEADRVTTANAKSLYRW